MTSDARKGERDLDRLIAGMRPVLHPETYLFCTTTNPNHPARSHARMILIEEEGITLILPEAAAGPDLQPVFACRMISLMVHSALDAVGLIAAVATRLAALDMGVNPVAGYFHDHLFVPADRAADAMAALAALSAERA
jgi:uncharacterized protein